MTKNLTARTVIIVVTILLCVYGIIGLPTSKAELVSHFQQNIRLGLDLKGGSHLVLQVQVQDAAKADANQTMDRLDRTKNLASGLALTDVPERVIDIGFTIVERASA